MLGGRSTCLAAASLILETENRRKVMKGKEGGRHNSSSKSEREDKMMDMDFGKEVDYHHGRRLIQAKSIK